MKNTKTVQVIMLPTVNNIKGTCTKSLTGILINGYSHSKNNQYQNQHLYFVNDESIEERDWIYSKSSIIQCIDKGNIREWKKIIATTDDKLINDGFRSDTKTLMPSIPELFIKSYIKSFNEGNIITKVNITMDKFGYMPDGEDLEYKINSICEVIIVEDIIKTYSKEKVIDLIKQAVYKKENGWKIKELNKWIEQNL